MAKISNEFKTTLGDLQQALLLYIVDDALAGSPYKLMQLRGRSRRDPLCGARKSSAFSNRRNN